jgi:hypothetical protein
MGYFHHLGGWLGTAPLLTQSTTNNYEKQIILRADIQPTTTSRQG